MGLIQCQHVWIMEGTTAIYMTALAITVIHPCLCLPTNLFLIYALRKTKQLSSISNVFMVIMCGSDSCFCIIAQPLTVIYLVNLISRKENCLVEFLAVLTGHFFSYFTFYMVIAIALDRYLRVTKLNNYNEHMNRRRALILVIVNTLLSASISFATVTSNIFLFEIKVIITVFNTIIILTISSCYFVVLRRVRIRPSSGLTVVQRLSKEDMKRRTRTIRTVRFLIAAVVIMYMPYNLSTLIRSYYQFHERRYSGEIIDMLAALSFVLVEMFSIINAVIYGIGNKEVKKYVKETLKRNKNSVTSSQGH